MPEFDVPSIGCSHCARAIAEAVPQVDRQAKVQVDIENAVRMETSADRNVLVSALTKAGYRPL